MAAKDRVKRLIGVGPLGRAVKQWIIGQVRAVGRDKAGARAPCSVPIMRSFRRIPWCGTCMAI
ncbi:hypothetical protein [Allosphingosinicella vermicomposti]|uniref:hypothetical protein n=1 Tax=Allosphingosinicella vermicomposti TaxID=614671 RepID=UPI000D1058AE|nr:hypothetical protein [Allosphingosinicella vermicomposti]